ncbi:hypothetical protein AAHE18_16G084800 [Arachis hypogaea]
MGGCFSDLEGGKQAVGVGFRSHQNQNQNQNPYPNQQHQGDNNNGAHNDAVDFFFKTKGFQPMFTQVESDPMVVVYEKKQNGKLQELGRTEVIMNNLNPEWIEKITVAFQFEIVQPLEFHVYDVDSKYHGITTKTLNLKDQDFLGQASCTLSEIVTKHSRSITLNLQNKTRHGGSRNLGALTIRAEETVASKIAIEMILRCSHLDNKDIFSKSDPFLRISRVVESGGSVPICKTEVINNNLNPTWRPVTLSSRQFGSKENPLLIECFDFNSSGDHVLIGKLRSSIADLERLNKERTGTNLFIPSTHHRKEEKMLKGQLFVDQYCEKEQFSFIDYVSSGFELNFMVAVDFTASNGNPRYSDSLHYIDVSGQLNSYQRAIMEVGEVIQFYDSDRKFPAWGFGGSTAGVVSHCFNLNGTPRDSEVVGVEGIMDAYATALHNVTLSGPTLFGPVINTAAEMAAKSLASHNGTKYYVLLIITDGVVTDLQETINALVKASDLPLSVLIVGVGGADFTNMEVLDADNGRRLEGSSGRIATRDIVQFVPMREVQRGSISVVQALLEELPGQFLSFMLSRDIKPLTSQQVPH